MEDRSKVTPVRNPIYGLTLWQPFATLLVAGNKLVENRSWVPWPRPPFWLAIHAAKSLPKVCWELEADCRAIWPDLPELKGLPRGAIIGLVRVLSVVDCDHSSLTDIQATFGEWATGPVCWFIDPGRRVTLDSPVAYKGKLGLFKLEPDLEGGFRELLCDTFGEGFGI